MNKLIHIMNTSLVPKELLGFVSILTRLLYYDKLLVTSSSGQTSVYLNLTIGSVNRSSGIFPKQGGLLLRGLNTYSSRLNLRSGILGYLWWKYWDRLQVRDERKFKFSKCLSSYMKLYPNEGRPNRIKQFCLYIGFAKETNGVVKIDRNMIHSISGLFVFNHLKSVVYNFSLAYFSKYEPTLFNKSELDDKEYFMNTSHSATEYFLEFLESKMDVI